MKSKQALILVVCCCAAVPFLIGLWVKADPRIENDRLSKCRVALGDSGKTLHWHSDPKRRYPVNLEDAFVSRPVPRDYEGRPLVYETSLDGEHFTVICTGHEHWLSGKRGRLIYTDREAIEFIRY